MAYASWSVVFGEQPSAAKWNILGTNDASFNNGTGIGNQAIFPNHVTSGGSSSSWAWQTYTPTYSGISGGTTNFAKYLQIGKTVHFRVKYTLAGAGVSGDTRVSLPVTANSDYTTYMFIGTGDAFDSSTSTHYPGVVGLQSTTSASLTYINVGGTYALWATATATIPITWATSDYIFWQGTYEAA